MRRSESSLFNQVHKSDEMVRIIPGRRERRATRVTFFIAGFATAAWAALIPFAKANTHSQDATLGLLLLCLGFGALIAMPLTGALTTRFGCKRVLIASAVPICLALPALAVITNVWLLAGVLLAFGVGVGVMDCAMNIQAIIVEKAADKPIMSGFHGFYSVGGIVGAVAMSGMMSIGLSSLGATAAVALVIVALLVVNVAGLLSYANPHQGPSFAIPRGTVLIIGLICFAVFLAEGTVLDWSAVYLVEYRDFPEVRAGLGFACFALTMTIARLFGDRIVAKLGARTVVACGALAAASGFWAAVLVPFWPVALLGYALIGFGCANIVPVMFSAIGRQTSMAQAIAVPAVTTLGYLGVLAGPAAVGFISHYGGLSTALLSVSALLLAVGITLKRVTL